MGKALSKVGGGFISFGMFGREIGGCIGFELGIFRFWRIFFSFGFGFRI